MRKYKKEAHRLKKIKRWQRAVKLTAKTSAEVNQEFQAASRLKKYEK